MLYYEHVCVKMFVLCNVHFVCTNKRSKRSCIKLYGEEYVIILIYFVPLLEPHYWIL